MSTPVRSGRLPDESTRADVPGHYRDGRESSLPTDSRSSLWGGRAVLVNGNNIGYWANQFAVRRDNLLHKERGPIFDDGDLDGTREAHTLLLLVRRRFGVRGDSARSGADGGLDTVVAVIHDTYHSEPTRRSPASPVLRRKAMPVAVGPPGTGVGPPPGLEVGRLVGSPAGDRRSLVRRHLGPPAAPLARIPMTAVGVDRDGLAVLAVVEQSTRSRGISLAGMAESCSLRRGRAVVLGAAGDAQLATTDGGFLWLRWSPRTPGVRCSPDCPASVPPRLDGDRSTPALCPVREPSRAGPGVPRRPTSARPRHPGANSSLA